VETLHQPIFLRSVHRWDSVILDDLPHWKIDLDVAQDSQCPGLVEGHWIDDLYICATIDPMDGLGGVVGIAGPEFVRMVEDKLLPVLGNMQYVTIFCSSLGSMGYLGSH